MPKAIIAAAAKSTSQRNRRLLATIQRISVLPGHQWPISSSVPYTSAAPTVTTSVPAGGPADSSTRSPTMRSTLTSSRRNVRAARAV